MIDILVARERAFVFDISKLPVKTAISVAVIIGLFALVIVGVPFWISYSRNEPFSVYGKEFGFSSQSDSQKLLEVRRQLSDVYSENLRLKEENATLVARQQAQARQAAAIWFPIEDIVFNVDGTFLTLDSKRKRQGAWSDPESELALQLMDLSDDQDEVVLRTNLPPPSNKLRMNAEGRLLVPMSKWEYQLTVLHIDSQQVSVRIERRLKSPAT